MKHPKGIVGLVHLGCAKTRVDAERLLAQRARSGWMVGASARADLVIVSTCAFINPAREESLNKIRGILKKKPHTNVLVSGCLPLWNSTFIKTMFPRVSISSKANLKRLEECGSARFLTTYPYAYLKIAEGCSRSCSFCLIPRLRGNFRSLEDDILLKEARQLKAMGIKELVLVAQDVTSYGVDLAGSPKLVELVGKLSEMNFTWIRLLYMYPNLVTRKLLKSLKAVGNVVPYLDIPLQHSHPKVLRLMGRGEKCGGPERVVGIVREVWPEAALRSTFMVGFPGEGEEEFGHLRDFILQTKFDRLALFPFYEERGSAASGFPEKVPQVLKEERYENLFKIQKQIYWQYNRNCEGRTLKVLVDQERGGWLQCRSFRDAPEIDGIVRVKGEGRVGDFLDVRVKKGLAYDLIGEIEKEEPDVQESSN